MPDLFPAEIPGLFIYKDRSGETQGLLFQFNPETLKRSRSVSIKKNGSSQTKGTTTGRGEDGRKYSMEVQPWKIDFELRLDASRSFRKVVGMVLAVKAGATQGFGGLSTIDSVLAAVRQLETLVEPTELEVVKGTNGYEERAQTPEVDFYWGDRVWKGYVTSLSINETLFSVALTPMMVEASISMEIIQPMSSVIAGAVGGLLA